LPAQVDQFLVVPNVHSDSSQTQIHDGAQRGYHIVLVAPHGDVVLLERNPEGSGLYSYRFLSCPNLWKVGDCDGFLNHNASSGYRVLPDATDASVLKNVTVPQGFGSRLVMEKPPQAALYSYHVQDLASDKVIPEAYAPVGLMFEGASSRLVLSERPRDGASPLSSTPYLIVGPDSSKKLVQTLNGLGAKGHRLALLAPTARFGGPLYALVYFFGNSESWEYALLTANDSAENLQRHLNEQGAKGFRPVIVAAGNLILERSTQGDPRSYSYCVVSIGKDRPFSAEIEKQLAAGYQLRLLVPLNLRPAKAFSFGDMSYASSPAVTLEKRE